MGGEPTLIRAMLAQMTGCYASQLAGLPTGYHANTGHLMSHLTFAKESGAATFAMSGACIAQPGGAS